MLKTLLCTGLVACATAAHAETWHFEYQGFHDSVADVFLPERRLTGSFIGQDSDSDGMLARTEITSFMLNGYDYVACESQSNEFWQCGMQAFAYAPGGALAFSAGQQGSDPEGWVGGGHYYISGDREYVYEYRPGHANDWAYLWTAQTTFAISAAPEPATWALLLAGIPLAVRAARRSRQQRMPRTVAPAAFQY